jgi:YHS domain-containing protein
MKLLSLLFCSIVLGSIAVFVASPTWAEDAPTTAPSTQPTAANNKTCPVSGDPVDPAITYEYNGKTYAFCCTDCIKAFKKDPEKYLKNVK